MCLINPQGFSIGLTFPEVFFHLYRPRPCSWHQAAFFPRKKWHPSCQLGVPGSRKVSIICPGITTPPSSSIISDIPKMFAGQILHRSISSCSCPFRVCPRQLQVPSELVSSAANRIPGLWSHRESMTNFVKRTSIVHEYSSDNHGSLCQNSTCCTKL